MNTYIISGLLLVIIAAGIWDCIYNRNKSVHESSNLSSKLMLLVPIFQCVIIGVEAESRILNSVLVGIPVVLYVFVWLELGNQFYIKNKSNDLILKKIRTAYADRIVGESQSDYRLNFKLDNGTRIQIEQPIALGSRYRIVLKTRGKIVNTVKARRELAALCTELDDRKASRWQNLIAPTFASAILVFLWL